MQTISRLILAPGMQRDDFEKLNSSLLELSERPGRAHFAVGSCHSDETSSVIKAMQKADGRMYEIKADYYARHPEYKWNGKKG